MPTRLLKDCNISCLNDYLFLLVACVGACKQKRGLLLSYAFNIYRQCLVSAHKNDFSLPASMPNGAKDLRSHPQIVATLRFVVVVVTIIDFPCDLHSSLHTQVFLNLILLLCVGETFG